MGNKEKSSNHKKLTKYQRKWLVYGITVVVLLIVSLIIKDDGFSLDNLKNEIAKLENSVYNQVTIEETEGKLVNVEIPTFEKNRLNVLYLYVGQADCTLVNFNDHYMLIDAGNNEDGKNIVSYLKKIGVTSLDYLVGTHADEDHIGGLDDIIYGLDVNEILMPTAGNEKPNYQNVVNAANKKNLLVTVPKINEKLSFGNTNTKVIAVDTASNNINNSSIVIQIDFENTKFLFMGDAEKEVEEKIEWEDIDVLKVGHHGSGTSSTINFLQKVKPEYAVIEVGKDNQYRLPNKNVLTRITGVGALLLRTDEEETSFYITSNGIDIKASKINVNLDGNEG